MSCKMILKSLCLFAMVFTGLCQAKENVSANLSILNDYVFRGQSQTAEHSAIQGGFDYAADSGFYAGIWGSNVDFG